jgi:predicted transcriptional regulator
MVLVSESPGEDHGALGVVTLEDVIEELIGEEIVDETDVFVDVSRHLKRVNPAVAFAHHTFHRISSRTHTHPEQTGRVSRQGSFHTPSSGTVKPLNKAKEPNPTTSTKVTIKPGTEMRNAQHAATIMSGEERLLAKNAARENYGSITPKGNDDGERRSRGSGTLIEERVTISSNGENGKVVISPVIQASDDEDEGRPLL